MLRSTNQAREQRVIAFDRKGKNFLAMEIDSFRSMLGLDGIWSMSNILFYIRWPPSILFGALMPPPLLIRNLFSLPTLTCLPLHTNPPILSTAPLTSSSYSSRCRDNEDTYSCPYLLMVQSLETEVLSTTMDLGFVVYMNQLRK
jgi:hypothetical protein